ncbi:MAG: hypothetical protein WBA91_00455 [Paracoccaceae bacterium]
MNRRTILLTALTLPVALSACGRIGQSKLNPFNWFGRSRRKNQQATLAPNEAADGRLLVREVTQMELSRMPTGVIVTAYGLPPTQGWWKADLVADNHGDPVDGVLTFRFLVFPPDAPQPVSTTQSRELSAGAFISNVRIDQIKEIVVQGELNARSTSRISGA